MAEVIENTLTRKDFVSDQEVRWCPGCGDYAILSAVQKVFPELGVPKENFLIVSGIGCSSRFPYYMDTYGFHSIHGRAPEFESGAKLANPDLSVWIVTGDGDGMSIGGNHLIHVLRRNLDLNILMFNNRIYGLTKGQYSPTSELGKVTKSTPMGSLDHPFNPPSLALGSGATFVARTIDRELKHMASIIKESHSHKGGSFVEIYQNCNIFNDGAFADMTDKETKMETQLILEQGQPMIFGKDKDKGLVLIGSQLTVLQLGEDRNVDDVLVHNSGDKNMARLLAGMTYNGDLPTPIGVFYKEERATYDEMMTAQLQSAIDSKGPGDLDALIKGSNTWTV
jgi:2-oxoglutarate ferredoxin oxidoreductase subunit beta